MSEALRCWRCGAPLDDVPLPMSRRAECSACHADLHVCRLCEFHDPRMAHECAEPIADEVKDKGRANFCGYFQPRAGAYQPDGNAEAEQAKAKLQALFGLSQPPGREEIDDEASRARRELERLFPSRDGGDDNKSGK